MQRSTRKLALLLLVAGLTACVRAYDCPRCSDGATGSDLVADLFGRDMAAGDARRDASGEAGASDLGLDGASPDASPDAAVHDLVGYDGHVPCTDYIFNNDVELVLDHYAATVEEVIYRQGSKTILTAPIWNYTNHTGLGRLRYEADSLLVSCDEGTNHLTLVYINPPLYGSKTFAFTWNPNGLKLEVTITNLKVNAEEWGMWKPGGDNDTDDWFRVLKTDKTTQDFKLTYPGGYQQIWSGAALGVAVWDDSYDEAFGYRYPSPGRQVVVGNGSAMDGPKQTLAAGGTYTFSFAIMHKADLLAWLP